MKSDRALVFVICYILFLFIFISTWIYLSGGTFEYRCSKIYKNDHTKFNECVQRLSKGHSLT